jgi:acyl-CoA-dependent ceramide synthase
MAQTSKTLNYLDSPIVGPYFGLFIFIWIYLRHYLNLSILWATITKFRTVGPFELNWETQQYKCWISQYITFALLASLQAVNVFWLVLILRIAKNYVLRVGLSDERSDDEEEDEETEGDAEQKKMPDGMKESPTVLVNGKPVEEKANGSGEGEQLRRSTREKKKDR